MGTKSRGRRAALLMLLSALGIVLGAGTARADGAPVGADIQVAQTLGARELTVIIRRTDLPPAPLQVDIVTHAGTTPGTLHLSVAAGGEVVSRADVTLGATPGVSHGMLRVDRPGPWELALAEDGGPTATIPFLVPARVVPPWEKATYGGFVAAGAFLLIALVVALRSRRTAFALIPAGGMVAALAVAVTGALLSASTPPPAPGSQLDPTIDNVSDPYANAQLSTVDYSRPPVNLAVRPENGDLKLAFTDGATGRPVDDLLVHDNALVHLVLVSPSGRMSHLHPVRVGPGDYRVRLADPESGTYAVTAELARRGGGVQLVRAGVDVTGTACPAPEPSGPGPRTVDGTQVDLAVTPGTPSMITAHFPAADLQPWLGMLGHLIIAGPLAPGPVGAAAAAAPTWAHAHAMIPPVAGQTAKPDETVAAYGPDVSFTYTFAAPGRYRIWLQAERNYSVVTIPAVIDVPQTGAGR